MRTFQIYIFARPTAWLSSLRPVIAALLCASLFWVASDSIIEASPLLAPANIDSRQTQLPTVTAENLLSLSGSEPLLIYLTLDCDSASFSASMFSQAFEDLRGVRLALANVRSADDLMQGKPFGSGTLAIAHNGKILVTTDQSPELPVPLTGFNNLRRWTYQQLAGSKLAFHMIPPPAARLPLPTALADATAPISLDPITLAHYSFDSDGSEQAGRLPPFTLAGRVALKDRSLFCDGTYDGRSGASLATDAQVFANGFALKLKFKLKSGADRKRIIFNVGRGALEAGVLDGQLYIATTVSGIPAYSNSDLDREFADDFFLLHEAPVETESWHDLTLSAHLQSGHLAIMLDGKQLDSIVLSERYLTFYHRYFLQQSGDQLIAFHNFNWGAVLDGSIDDLLLFNRPLTLNELAGLGRTLPPLQRDPGLTASPDQ